MGKSSSSCPSPPEPHARGKKNDPRQKSGGRCSVSAEVSATSCRLKGRGGSPSGPKIQAQRADQPKSNIQNLPLPSPTTRHSPFAIRHSGYAVKPKFKIQHPKFFLFPPVAVVATTPSSGFGEMILHLPIQNQPHSLPATSYSLLS